MALTSPPVVDDPGATPERRRRRLRRLVVLVCAFLIVGAVTSTVAGVTHYAPMQTGGLEVGPPAMVHEVKVASSGQTVSGVGFAPGKDFTIELDLFNRGRWGITVTGFPSDESADLRSNGVEISSMDASENMGEPRLGNFVAFHAFAIAPRRFRRIRLRFRFESCATKASTEAGSTFETMEQFQVRFNLAGVSRTQWVQLAKPVPIDVSDVVACAPR